MIGNDHWTVEIERLGMQSAGDELARLALCCRPPFAICVQGKWGSGKTSLMRYAMAKLGGRPLSATLATDSKALGELPADVEGRWNSLCSGADSFILDELRRIVAAKYAQLEPLIVPIWFNPWQHQRTELPVVGLLHEIRSQFTALMKLSDGVSRLTQNAVEAALPLLGSLAAAIGALQGLPGTGILAGGADARVSHRERHFETEHDAQRLNLLFEQAVRRLLAIGQGQELAEGRRKGYFIVPRRIVVFIDDLDRCGEEQTVHLLEAMKLYLQTSHCVFVVGMDSSATRRAVAKVLGQGQEVAREYLEKLFQATLHVPLPTRELGYVGELLAYCGLDEAKTGVASDHLANLVLDLVEPNPRKLKTFVSSLAAGWCLCGGKSAAGFTPFLLVSYLKAVHPDVYRLLSYDPAQAVRLHRVQEQVPQPDASPVDHFLQQEFRHAFGYISDKDEVRSRVVIDLIGRLDQLKGDQAFLRLWKEWAKEMNGEQVVSAMRPLLRGPEV